MFSKQFSTTLAYNSDFDSIQPIKFKTYDNKHPIFKDVADQILNEIEASVTTESNYSIRKIRKCFVYF